ncbi:MAG: response regulator [Sulfurimonadaceae bacterium]
MSNKKINIVIIDDEDQILTMLSKFLSRDPDYSIKTYANPLNAIAAVNKDTDIILLDIMMPQLNGIEALPKLLEKNPQVKILMMTAYSTLDKVLNAHRYGAHDYIMKPFSSLDALGKKVKELLNK